MPQRANDHATVAFEQVWGETPRGLWIGEVAGVHKRGSPGVGDLVADLLEQRSPPGREQHGRAGAGEPQCGGLTDPGGCARDQDDLA